MDERIVWRMGAQPRPRVAYQMISKGCDAGSMTIVPWDKDPKGLQMNTR